MNTFLKYIFAVSLLLTTSLINAQIESTGHTFSQKTAYPNDTIFFYSDINNASISATVYSGSNVTYTWERYETGSWSGAITGLDPSNTNLSEGAYRVTVNENGNPVKQNVCWVFQPEILSVDVDTLYSNCTSMQLSAIAANKPLNYVNPNNGDAYTVDYIYDYTWTSDPVTETSIDNVAQPIIEPAVEAITYNATISAFSGAHDLSNSFSYNDPKAVKADFTFNVFDKGHPNDVPDVTDFDKITDFKGSGEVLITINDDSKGLNRSYSIDFSTDDGEEKPSEDDLIEVIFDKLGSYMMTVNITNDISRCTDSKELGPIEIEEIELQAPNVFTPDGDGINDKFMVIYASIKDFKMVIFNRWGRKVFQTTDPGEAWDGKIAGKDAAEGVYFYVITAEGFNKGESRKLEGPLHLLRGQ